MSNRRYDAFEHAMMFLMGVVCLIVLTIVIFVASILFNAYGFWAIFIPVGVSMAATLCWSIGWSISKKWDIF